MPASAGIPRVHQRFKNRYAAPLGKVRPAEPLTDRVVDVTPAPGCYCLLRPALAAVIPNHHAAATLLKRSFDALDTRIAAWLAKNQLGQSNLTHSREIPFLKQT